MIVYAHTLCAEWLKKDWKHSICSIWMHLNLYKEIRMQVCVQPLHFLLVGMKRNWKVLKFSSRSHVPPSAPFNISLSFQEPIIARLHQISYSLPFYCPLDTSETFRPAQVKFTLGVPFCRHNGLQTDWHGSWKVMKMSTVPPLGAFQRISVNKERAHQMMSAFTGLNPLNAILNGLH